MTDLDHLRAKLLLLRELGVASYQKDGEKETINLFPPVPEAPSERELHDAMTARQEIAERVERQRVLGASGGIVPNPEALPKGWQRRRG